MALTVRSDAGGTFGAVQFNAEDILRFDGAKAYAAPGKTIVANGGAVTASGSYPISTPGGVPIVTFTDTNRIQGDFSNATPSQRLMFQSSVLNGNTFIGTIPNGTGAISGYAAYSSSDSNNSALVQIASGYIGGTVNAIDSTRTGTGAYLPLAFFAGQSERFRLSAIENRFQADFSNATITNQLAFQTSTVNGATSVATLPNGTGTVAAWRAINNSNPVNSSYIQIAATGTVADIGIGALGSGTQLPLTFTVNGSERARISTTGIFMFGTTAADRIYNGGGGPQPGFAFEHTGSFLAQRNNGPVVYISKASGYTDSTFIAFNVNGTGVGSITTNGTTTAYNTGSDYRLKENIEAMQKGALDRITALKPSTWKWKGQDTYGEGFIAHELAKVVPLAVTGEKDGEEMQQVDYAKLTPLLVAAVQELLKRVEYLENLVTIS